MRCDASEWFARRAKSLYVWYTWYTGYHGYPAEPREPHLDPCVLTVMASYYRRCCWRLTMRDSLPRGVTSLRVGTLLIDRSIGHDSLGIYRQSCRLRSFPLPVCHIMYLMRWMPCTWDQHQLRESQHRSCHRLLFYIQTHNKT